MKILFIHQSFPAQFKHLAPALATDPNNQVLAMHMQTQAVEIPGVRMVFSAVSRSNTPDIHPWLLNSESKVIRGEAAWRTACQLREEGFEPDIIVAHPGWGEALFVKDVWPKSKLLCYFEYFYRAQGADVGFDPEFPTTDEDMCQLRLKNFTNLTMLEASDAGITPTDWQRQTYPDVFHHKIEVIHDGVDIARIAPRNDVQITLPGLTRPLTKSDEIVTFVSRYLEPYRGFHTFMRALPELLARRPKAQILIVGGVGAGGYGGTPNIPWKDRYLAEIGDRLDHKRVHFLGVQPHAVFVQLLQVSSVHIYLTYPFILSWSMLEAMSAGCLVVGSDTPPVREIIEDGVNGLLVDFFSSDSIVNVVDEVLDHPTRMQNIREAARKTIIENYDLKNICLPRQIALIDRLVERSKSAAPNNGQSEDAIFSMARDYHGAGNINQAKSLYEQVLERNPNHAGALHYLGVVAHQEGCIDLAEELISQAIAIKPSELMYLHHGLILSQSGKPELACEDFHKALSINPKNIEALCSLGDLSRDLGRLNDACDYYYAALAIKPDFLNALNNLGLVLQTQGQLSEALNCFDKATQVAPACAFAHSNRGNVLRVFGEYDEAIKCYEKAAKIDPGMVESYVNLGVVYYSQGKLDLAVKNYQKALKINSRIPEIYNNIGNAFKDAGHFFRQLKIFVEQLS